MLTPALLGALTILAHAQPPEQAASGWMRAGLTTDQPVWGLAEGIVVGLWPAGIGGPPPGGPRGLLRIGYPVETERRHHLVNFIAVEPDIGDGNWRGLSELEFSELDGERGKRFTPENPSGAPAFDGPLPPGLLDHPDDAPEVERLRLLVRVERFQNGAHPYLMLTFRDDRPDEVAIATFHEPDSALMTRCVITATMGNYARLRRAHLADGETLLATDLWPGHRGPDFTWFRSAPRERLATTTDGAVVVPMECDEPDPAGNWPHDPAIWWRWPWEKLTQYWRAARHEATEDLYLAVNGRAEYWGGGAITIPGGVAFENTELRLDYQPGREVIFGITRATPQELLQR